MGSKLAQLENGLECVTQLASAKICIKLFSWFVVQGASSRFKDAFALRVDFARAMWIIHGGIARYGARLGGTMYLVLVP